MTEVARAGKHHRDAMFVRGCDDLVVPHRAAGLDDGLDARLRGRVEGDGAEVLAMEPDRQRPAVPGEKISEATVPKY